MRAKLFNNSIQFLGALATLRKPTISFAMSVCPSVSLFIQMEELSSVWTDFNEILYLSIFRKYFSKIQLSLRPDESNCYFTWRPTHFLIISRSFNLVMRNVTDKICRKYQSKHSIFSNYFQQSWRLWDNVEKYCTAEQGRDNNIAHAQCKLDTKG